MLEGIAVKVLEGATSKALDILFERIREKNKELLRRRHPAIVAQREAQALPIGQKIKAHIEELKRWSSTTSLFDLLHKKEVGNIFVELETFLMPVKTHFSDEEKDKRQSLQSALMRSPQHAVILGQPGAGKTTSLQKVCLDYFRNGKALLNHNLPLLIRLRDVRHVSGYGPVSYALADLVGLDFKFDMNGDDDLRVFFRSVLEEVLVTLLDSLNAVVLIDGLDEISAPALQQEAIADLRMLTTRLKQSKVLLTCRSGDFRYSFDGTSIFEIAPLSEDQVRQFVTRWLPSPQEAAALLKQLFDSPFADTAMRPLSLAHLCAIYERMGKIPDEPKSVYRKVVNLLIEEWDAQRSVRRTTQYSRFTVDRKFDFLCVLAYELTTDGALRFDATQLELTYRRICVRFGLPAGEAKLVARELESHTGLLIETGYQQYEFAHKSIQEYLTAEYLVRLPDLKPISAQLGRLPAELAVAVALSSHPGEYLGVLVKRWLYPLRLPPAFFRSFQERLVVERPELSSSENAVLGAAVMISAGGAADTAVELLRPIFTTGAKTFLNHYYGESRQFDDKVHFSGRLNDPEDILPRMLILPATLLGMS